jgi:hypothetical protein
MKTLDHRDCHLLPKPHIGAMYPYNLPHFGNWWQSQQEGLYNEYSKQVCNLSENKLYTRGCTWYG